MIKKGSTRKWYKSIESPELALELHQIVRKTSREEGQYENAWYNQCLSS